MAWTVRHAPAAGAIETTLTGIVTPAELRAAARAGIDAGLLNQCDFHLCDATGFTGGLTIFDLYALVGALRDLGVPTTAHQAVLPPPGDAALRNAIFWETACRNRGFDVRVFDARAAALAWLAAFGTVTCT